MTTKPSLESIAAADLAQLQYLIDHTPGLYRHVFSYPCPVGEESLDELRQVVAEFFYHQQQAA
ncbi:hypothetical protein MPL3356_60571 [Mesorhizobium plurifarium]|uniref:Uncharacterized protein n=1 Tax=Mesorhizobium plurifarium TaxID=69974 RepID=A0A090G794_MESPL|nr:hypothetical protein MPL3356_60571 [Mesorhizobium plurifarium]